MYPDGETPKGVYARTSLESEPTFEGFVKAHRGAGWREVYPHRILITGTKVAELLAGKWHPFNIVRSCFEEDSAFPERKLPAEGVSVMLEVDGEGLLPMKGDYIIERPRAN